MRVSVPGVVVVRRGSEKVAADKEGSEFHNHLRKREEKEDEPKPAYEGEGDILQW